MGQSKRFALDEFGQAVMTHVRDDAISFLERLLAGKMADSASKELYSQLSKCTQIELEAIEKLTVTAVDASLVRFLNFIDEFELQLLFRSRSGEILNIREFSDGLAGELHTNNGWIAKFSKYGDHLGAK